MTARWRETISIEDLWEGDMTAVVVDGEAVLLVNIDGTVRAYSNRCPTRHRPWTRAIWTAIR
jgi:toluene monooxygenase system ferredoxin subunit